MRPIEHTQKGAAPPALSGPYIDLFGRQAVVRYAWQQQRSDDLPRAELATARSPSRFRESEVACTIASRAVGSYWVSTMTCVDPAGADIASELHETLIANDRGLWTEPGAAAEITRGSDIDELLADRPPYLASRPVAGIERQTLDGGFGRSKEISFDNGTVCVVESWWGGHPGGRTRCFRAGSGLLSVSRWSDGSTSEAENFDLRPETEQNKVTR